MHSILYFLLFWCIFSVSAKEYVYLVDTGYEGLRSCGTYHLTTDKVTTHKHGHKMAKIIIDGLKGDFCVKSYNVYNSESESISVSAIEDALLSILKEKPGIVNLSMDGGFPSFKESFLLKKLVDKGFTLHIAGGNDATNLDVSCNTYPACYFTGKEKRVKIVGNAGKFSNKNGPINIIDSKFKKGTSESTAYVTHLKLKEVLNESNKRVRTESLWWIQRATRSNYCKNNARPRRTSQDCQEQRQTLSSNEPSYEPESRRQCSSRAIWQRPRFSY